MELAERFEFVLAEKAQFRQHAVVAGGGVALAEDEAVPVGPMWVFGIDPHLRAEDGAHQLHGGQRAAGVPAAGVRRHVDDIPPHFRAEGLKLWCVHD